MSTPPTVPSGSNLYSQGFGSTPSGSLNSSIRATRAPAATDIKGPSGTFPVGQRWVDQVANASYTLTSFTALAGTVAAVWVLDGGGSGAIATLTGDSGGAISPSGGNINLLGTANQITTTGSGSTITSSIPATFIAPGSIASTTSTTAGTTLTATLGAITATNGNLVLGTAGNKIISTSVASTTTAGANSFGKVTLVAGTATVATTAITANSIVMLTRDSPGATGAAALGMLSVGTKSANVSFIINALTTADSTALATTDVSSISWMIIN